MSLQIDLNADLGEGAPFDADIMPLISSCNIACGGHAGDAQTMAATLELAKAAGVQAGAHPAYPDRAGFGRERMDIELDTLSASVSDQIATLADIAAKTGVGLSHVKPHGMLYNEAAKDTALATLIAGCASALGPATKLLGPPGSALEYAATQTGLRFVAEGFVDRAYAADGSLVPRGTPGAMLEPIETREAQAMMLISRGEALGPDGVAISLPVETLCLHGDSPEAVKTAQAIRQRLQAEHINVRPPQ